MSVQFHVGQKVVLAFPYDGQTHRAASFCGETLPSAGIVYTIREIEPPDHTGLVFIRVFEIVNPAEHEFGECAFNSQRFRPLTDRKTDISIFTDMLNRQKTSVPA
jgi:hypothetical protein